MNILLTNGHLRKTLTTIRAFKNKDIKVFSSENTKINPAGFSKYCYKSLVYPDIKKKPLEFKKWLFKTFDNFNIDIFIPMDDDILECTKKYWQDIKSKVLFPFPKETIYNIASDKYLANKIAFESGLYCPTTFTPDSYDKILDILTKEYPNLTYPLVIKPRKSSGSRGIRIVNSKNELLETYTLISSKYKNPVIQEFIPINSRYDVCLLVNQNSNIIASFVQKEIRHFPIEIGPSTMQESLFIPELIDMCKPLIKKLSWYGIIEIEFMYDLRDNTFKFMEINPRFWNSLNTSILSGVNFPLLLVNMLTNKKINKTFKYSENIKSRSLFPNDILNFIYNKNRFKEITTYISKGENKIYDDLLTKSDLMPFLGFFLSVLKHIPNPEMWKFFFKR